MPREWRVWHDWRRFGAICLGMVLWALLGSAVGVLAFTAFWKAVAAAKQDLFVP